MKFILTVAAATFLAISGVRAQILTTNTYSQSVGGGIPDQNPNGTNSTINVGGIIGTIQDIRVFLDITNGYNGDLYGYLSGPNGGFAVLLNRVGVTTGNPFGYGDTGFNVTFSLSTTNNIHYYQNLGGTLNSGGQLTGTWAADGRNIDPLSSPSTFDSTSPTATLSSFLGTDPNGDWTLFLSDLSGEYTSTWDSWGIQIVSVPEPASGQLLAMFGAFGAAAFFLRRRRARING